MSTELYTKLLQALQGAALAFSTNNNSIEIAKNYQDIRTSIISNFSVHALPSFARNHRTAQEVRAYAQSLNGLSNVTTPYSDRRDWINKDINEMLHHVEINGSVPDENTTILVNHSNAQSVAENIQDDTNLNESNSETRANISLPSYLHPDILSRCLDYFNAADYDTAVLKAYRYIEVRLREKAQLEATDVGLALATKALSPSLREGKLLQMSPITPEQEGFLAIFRGAIAVFKNPQSHHEIGLNIPERAAEIISMASAMIYMIEGSTIIDRGSI